MSSNVRLYQIDLLRFIAALSVLLCHYTFGGYKANNGWSNLEFSTLGDIFKYGYLGVHLFFIISGFVIILSIQDGNVFNFIRSRITRLYPAYWFCVTMTFLVMYFFGAPVFFANFKEYCINLTMFQRYFNIKNIDAVYWTLAIELKFYFLIVLYLLFNLYKKIDIKYFIYFLLFITILPKILHTDNEILSVFFSLFDTSFNSFFIAGMLFYKIYTGGNKLIYNTLLLLCCALSLKSIQHEIVSLSQHYQTPFNNIVVYSILLLFYTVMYLCSTKKLSSFNKPLFVKLGILTYPLYLIHENIGFIIFNNLDRYINKYVLLVGTTALMLLVAYLIHIYIEKPFSVYLKTKIMLAKTYFDKKKSGITAG